MNRRSFHLPVHAFLIVSVALVAASGMLLREREAPAAFADPAFGSLKLSPSNGVVIVGHRISVPVALTTCTDVVGTATGGSSTTLADTTKTWTTNQWAGNSVLLTSGAGAPDTRTVASNTGDTLTLSQPWGAVVTGTASGQDTGTATGASSFNIADTSKAWIVNQWRNFTMTLTGGAGSPQTRTVSSSTETLLTVSPPFGTILANGTATGATTTTLVDASKAWTVNQWAGKNVDLLAGIGAPQTALIVSNTANTLTIAVAWTTTPLSGTTYDIRQTLDPAAGTTYQVGQNSTATTLVSMRSNWIPSEYAGYALDLLTGTGAPQTRTVSSNTSNTLTISSPWTAPLPVSGTTFQLRSTANLPGSGTGYTLGTCRPGAYDITMTYDPTKFSVLTDAGTSTGGNTTTVLMDTTKVWKLNQWSNSRLFLTGGPVIGDAIVVSNTANSITVATAFPLAPDATSTYSIGGITDGGFLGSTGRPVTCPVGPAYGANYVALHCITTGLTPNGAIGTGPIVNVVMQANAKGVNIPFNLTTGPTPSSILTVDAQNIPADMITGLRRVILCPDPDNNNVVNSGDLAIISQALNQRTGDPLYTVKKDPDENGVINSGDLAITASVFNQRCVEP